MAARRFIYMPIAKPQKPNQHKKIRHDIQALRAFAVVAVVLYHLWPGRLEGGFTGVDIFFVISGYLMTVSIMGRLNPLAETGTITVKNVLHLLTEFYARRIKRLVPAALVTLVGILGMSALTNNLTIIIDNAKNVISAATFWENWHLAKQSVDYLHHGDAPVAAQHFWSLSLEEQFYLMWPLVLIVSTLITLNIVIYYKRQKIAGAILPITLITIASLAYGYWLTQSEPSIAYFSTPARVWELMIGGIIAFLPVIKNYDLKLLLPHVGLAMCLYSVFFITGDDFPGWHALIPTIGAALIVMGGVGKTESSLSFGNLFRWRPIQWIGDISYSIYLWHWPLIILLPVILHIDIDGSQGKVLKFGIIILTLIIAHVSYKFIEEPARKVQLNTRYIYILFILLTGLVVGGGFAVKKYGEHQTEARLSTMHAAALDTENVCFGARAILHLNKCDDPYGKINPNNMSVGREDDFKTKIYDKKECYSFNPKVENRNNPQKWCTFGDESSKKTIVLLGDSHAEQYINAFDAIGKKNNYKVYSATSVGCKGLLFTGKDLCKQRLQFLNSSGILNSKAIIVLSFVYLDYASTAKGINNIRNISDSPIALLSDTPRSTPDAINKCYTFGIKCTREYSAASGWSDEITNRLIKKGILKNNEIISMTDAFCTPSKCYASIGGVPVYYNTTDDARPSGNSHITASYSFSLSPLIEQKLRHQGFLR